MTPSGMIAHWAISQLNTVWNRKPTTVVAIPRVTTRGENFEKLLTFFRRKPTTTRISPYPASPIQNAKKSMKKMEMNGVGSNPS